MSEKSRWQQEFDSLPEWAQKLVRASAHIGMYGGVSDEWLGAMLSAKKYYDGVGIAIHSDHSREWWDGFYGMKELSEALTAPWPPPPAPERPPALDQAVEMVADEDDSAYDQPCAFGHRVEGHAVYCHNEAWPNSPRKCRRTWYTNGEVRDEDCPGFVANPGLTAAHPAKEARPRHE